MLIDASTDPTPATTVAGSPRAEGLEAEVYAVNQEATAIGAPGYVTRADALKQRLINQWIPFFSASSIKSDTEALAAEMASTSGRPNILDVPLANGGNVDTPDREKFISGDGGAALSAAFDDLHSSWSDFLKNTAPTITTGGYILVAVLSVLLFIMVLRETRA